MNQNKARTSPRAVHALSFFFFYSKGATYLVISNLQNAALWTSQERVDVTPLPREWGHELAYGGTICSGRLQPPIPDKHSRTGYNMTVPCT